MDDSFSAAGTYLKRLTLPKGNYDALSYCDTTPDGLSAYLAELPHSNAAELCNRLYRLVPEVAGLQMLPGRKIALLDMVRPEVYDCVLRLTSNLAITPASAKLLSISIALLKHLAEGYKAVLATLLKSPASPPNLVVVSIFSAIEVLRKALMECWECYVPPPPNTWMEIHALFSIARRMGLDRQIVERDGLRPAPTIRSCYTVPLLMACADPGRFTPPDLRTIEKFLDHSATLVEFAQNHLDGIFVVDTNSDKGPQYSFKIEGTTVDHFRLRPSRLVKHIEENLAERTLVGLNERLARDLCRYWSHEIRRAEDPELDNTPLDIVIGLSHIHRHLSNTKNLDEFVKANRPASKSSLEVLELVDDGSSRHRDMFLQKAQQPNFASMQPHQELPAQNQPNSMPLRHYSAIRTNMSAKGARIEFDGPGETLTAGEAVYLTPEGTGQGQLALVRWTKITHQLKRMLGIQVLSQHAEPCAVSKTTSAGNSDEQFYPGLLFNTDDNRQILLPTLPFKPYTSASLYMEGSKRDLSLGACLESSFHVSVYKVEDISHL